MAVAVDMRLGLDTIFQPREMTDRERDIVADTLQEFRELQLYRFTFATQWEETSLLLWPDMRNTFQYGNFNWPGQKKTDKQVDATGMVALERFTAIVNSLITPENMFWHALEADNDYVMKDRQVRRWFEMATKILFRERYRGVSGYVGQNVMCYKSLGAFGNMGLFIDDYNDKTFGYGRVLRYRYEPLGGLYIRVNHQNMIDGFIRHYRATANQILQEFGPENFPMQLVPALNLKSQTPYNVIHRVVPRNDYDSDALGPQRMRFASYTIFVGAGLGAGQLDGHGVLLRESGYYSFPLPFGRYTQAPMEIYGRGPAQMVLPSLKTLNAEKSTFLKAGHRAADPIYLTADEAFDPTMVPGFINKGGVNPDGKPMMVPLMPGNIQISEKMMAEEGMIVKDMFLVNLFQILTQTPTMSATEVVERTNEKGIMLAPTIGRQAEFLGVQIHRELDLLARMGKLPPMPPRLREAGGEYNIVYTSPLAKAMRSGQASGFMRTVEWAKEIVGVTGDQGVMDRFDFDTAMPEIANINSVPESWMADDDQVTKKRTQRAKAAQMQAQIQAMPAQAAMIKAQAVANKAGGGQPPQQGGAPQDQQQQQQQPQQPGGLGQ